MPLVKGKNGSVSIVYNLPKELKKLIDIKFAKTLILEVEKIFPYTKESDSIMIGALGLEGGTCGMDDAIKNTCKKMHITEFEKEYNNLEGYYDYDLFADEILNTVGEVHFGKEKYRILFEEFYKENYEQYEINEEGER